MKTGFSNYGGCLLSYAVLFYRMMNAMYTCDYEVIDGGSLLVKYHLGSGKVLRNNQFI